MLADHPHARGENALSFQMLLIEADHPHARGENWVMSGWYGEQDGPSPRTWGERPVRSRRGRAWRTIPTHVGRTSTGVREKCQPPDHPHARGENLKRF